MNGAGTQKRRSARLSHEGAGENEPPAKRSRASGAQVKTVSTKEQGGDSNTVSKRKPRKQYEEVVDDFAFSKKSKKKVAKEPAVRNSNERPATPPPAQGSANAHQKPSTPKDEAGLKTGQKKTRRRFPTTPERENAEKPTRRSKRLSSENAPPEPQRSSRHKPAHAKSHANQERSPSPDQAEPVTVEKKRKRAANGGEEEEKIMRIALPFQDTPVIKRNKEMRKTSAEGHRRSSSGMRGRRASSLIDEGRGTGTYTTGKDAEKVSEEVAASTGMLDALPLVHTRRVSFEMPDETISRNTAPLPSDSTSLARPNSPQPFKFCQETFADMSFPGTALPHAEVSSEEFFKHISADLTEPRRMRVLLGWCGTRALPPKPEAPKQSTPDANLEFQALQAARVIQDELSQDLITKGTLSDWFSRDDAEAPPIQLKKKPNPRNVTNATKAEELEVELERLKKERAEWDDLMKSAVPPSPPTKEGAEAERELSPLHPDLLDSPQRKVLEQLQAPATESSSHPEAVQKRLRNVSDNLEFSVDQFAHGMHTLITTRDTAERLADKSLSEAAEVLEDREKERRATGKSADAFDALKALGKVMNGRRR
ncbi:hypothetical protein D0862_11415 [Hortaea werneckii]|uniref:Kinetochore protein mis13 n=1 Tax=Hortaea werneckii TaxID=91943 RepID=A0A3M7F6J2_HORWE|nr:hypothetical protein D0862_11415 [Hortaea werneckii]